eukprot:69979-Rhodomonas_salina.1
MRHAALSRTPRESRVRRSDGTERKRKNKCQRCQKDVGCGAASPRLSTKHGHDPTTSVSVPQGTTSVSVPQGTTSVSVPQPTSASVPILEACCLSTSGLGYDPTHASVPAEVMIYKRVSTSGAEMLRGHHSSESVPAGYDATYPGARSIPDGGSQAWG